MEYILLYLAIFFVVLFINGFIQGYYGGEITRNDIIESFFWIMYVPVLLGTIAKVIINKYAEYKNTKKGKK